MRNSADKTMTTTLAEHSLTGLAELIVALAGLTTAMLAVAKWAAPWAGRLLDRRTLARDLSGLRDINLTLREATDEGHCDRAIIFAGHNGDGKPKPGARFYASAIHWCRNAMKTTEKISDYVDIPLDQSYVLMLGEVLEKGEYLFVTAKEDASLLKSVYQTANVQESLICFLCIQNKRFYYVSFARLDGHFSEADKTHLRLLANRLRVTLLAAA